MSKFITNKLLEARFMEDLLRPIYQERASSQETTGVLLVEKRKPISPLTDNFDAVLLVVVSESDRPWFVKHYNFDGKKAALHIVDHSQLNEWLMLGSNRRAVDWILNGKIMFERNEFLSQLRQELSEFPELDRHKKMTIEFAKLTKRFSDGKDQFDSKQYLDAFNSIVHALHHLARLAVIDKGFHPEVTVWSQVKQIEPPIHKLYQELTASNESLEKRLGLLLLASEVSISSHMDRGTQFLIHIMKEEELWSFGSLISHPLVKDFAVDLSSLLEYLVDKDVIEVVNEPTKSKLVYHRMYRLKK
jgi:hypothetical protein